MRITLQRRVFGREAEGSAGAVSQRQVPGAGRLFATRARRARSSSATSGGSTCTTISSSRSANGSKPENVQIVYPSGAYSQWWQPSRLGDAAPETCFLRLVALASRHETPGSAVPRRVLPGSRPGLETCVISERSLPRIRRRSHLARSAGPRRAHAITRSTESGVALHDGFDRAVPTIARPAAMPCCSASSRRL